MKKTKKKGMSTPMTIITMLLVMALVMGVFFALRANRPTEEPTHDRTETEKLIERDLEANYPGNAREVVKFYNRILKCFYNEELTEDELKALAGQARILFDTELLKRNPMDQYLDRLRVEIADYQVSNRTILSIGIQDYKDVKFETKGQEQTASLLSSYLLRQGGESGKNYMRYYLREDENGRWRILFWELSDETF